MLGSTQKRENEKGQAQNLILPFLVLFEIPRRPKLDQNVATGQSFILAKYGPDPTNVGLARGQNKTEKMKNFS